jgi:fructose/tagatose bisphosphate aldolase
VEVEQLLFQEQIQYFQLSHLQVEEEVEQVEEVFNLEQMEDQVVEVELGFQMDLEEQEIVPLQVLLKEIMVEQVNQL